MRLRLLKFSFDIVHVPGKQLITADTLSRAPVKQEGTLEDKDKEAEVAVFIDMLRNSLPATETRLKKTEEKQKADSVCAKLIEYCSTEWPQKHALPPELGPYWPEKENLTLAGRPPNNDSPLYETRGTAGSTQWSPRYCQVQGKSPSVHLVSWSLSAHQSDGGEL